MKRFLGIPLKEVLRVPYTLEYRREVWAGMNEYIEDLQQSEEAISTIAKRLKQRKNTRKRKRVLVD